MELDLTSVIVVLVTTVWFLLFSPIQLMVYLVIIPLGINGCDQNNSNVEELLKLILRFNGVCPGTALKRQY